MASVKKDETDTKCVSENTDSIVITSKNKNKKNLPGNTACLPEIDNGNIESRIKSTPKKSINLNKKTKSADSTPIKDKNLKTEIKTTDPTLKKSIGCKKKNRSTNSTPKKGIDFNKIIKSADSTPTKQENWSEQETVTEQNKTDKIPSNKAKNKYILAKSTNNDISGKEVTTPEKPSRIIEKHESIAYKIKKAVTPNKKGIAIAANKMSSQQDSLAQTENSSKTTLLQKDVAKNSPSKLQKIVKDMPVQASAEKSTVTEINSLHDSVPRADLHDKSTNESDDNKDTVLIKIANQTTQPLQKTPKKKIAKRIKTDKNVLEESVLNFTPMDVVKVELQDAENTFCDDTTENNSNGKLLVDLSTNVNTDISFMSPQKNEVLDQVKLEICKTEAVSNSPQATPPKIAATFSMPLFTPNCCKSQDSATVLALQTTEKVENLFENDVLKEAPVENKTPKIKINSDSEDSSNSLRYELCDPDRLDEFEAIELSHDFDTAINFEDSKITSGQVLTPLLYDCFTQPVGEKADIDPLFIDPSVQNIQNPVKQKVTSKRKKKYNNFTTSSSKKARLSEYGGDTGIEQEEIMENKRILETKSLKGMDERASADDFKRLYNMDMKLLHKPVTQHTKDEFRNYCRSFTNQQRRSFQNCGPCKMGPFTPMEDHIIHNNWTVFCKLHEWPPSEYKPFLQMRRGGAFIMKKHANRIKFIQFLANGLPWRPLYKVYYRFRSLYKDDYATCPRGNPYTENEDKQIMSYLEKNASDMPKRTCYMELSKILGRTACSIRLRHNALRQYEELNKKERLFVRQWTLSSIEEFVAVLLSITMCESIGELKYAIIPAVVWNRVAKELNIEATVLKKYWYMQLHMQLFYQKPIYLNDIKIQLIEYIYGTGVSCQEDIQWTNLIKYFDGMTTQFLQRVLYELTRQHKKTTPFIETVEDLYHNKIPQIQKDDFDRFLPRFGYIDGIFCIIDDSRKEE